MTRATKEETLELIRDIGAGRKSYQLLRNQLAVLGFMAKNIEPQMGQDGRASFEELLAAWTRMAEGGDADGRKILQSLADHPVHGEAVRALLARL